MSDILKSKSFFISLESVPNLSVFIQDTDIDPVSFEQISELPCNQCVVEIFNVNCIRFWEKKSILKIFREFTFHPLTREPLQKKQLIWIFFPQQVCKQLQWFFFGLQFIYTLLGVTFFSYMFLQNKISTKNYEILQRILLDTTMIILTSLCITFASCIQNQKTLVYFLNQSQKEISREIMFALEVSKK